MSQITRIFFSTTPRRLRAGWRLLLWLVLMLAISALILVPFSLVRLALPEWIFSGMDGSLAVQAVSVIAITGSIFIARRLFDRRSIRSLGLRLDRTALKDLLAGFLIAGVLMFFIFFLLRVGGFVQVNGFVWQQAQTPGQVLAGLALMFWVFFFVGWQEELFARGYLLQNLEDGLGFLRRSGEEAAQSEETRPRVRGRWSLPTLAAVLISSLVFGLGHAANPNATWTGVLGTGLAGVFLAYAYLRTRSLWLPIGLHLGWNFFEGVVLGFPVSGLTNFFTLVSLSSAGPDWWTGGAFGPEAGLVLLPGLALGTALVWYWTMMQDKRTHEDHR